MASVDPGSFTSFGELLRYLRQRERLTQRQLAVAVGYSDAQIARLEGSKRSPDPVAVRARFIEALDLQNEPALARRLVELAVAVNTEMPGITQQTPALNTQTATARLTNLPSQLASFVGREREMAEVTALVSANWLVTLTGAGGVGKTRLAMEVGTSLLGRTVQPTQLGTVPGVASNETSLPDGVWLAELAAVSEANLLPNVLVGLFGLAPGTQKAHDVLTDHLRHKHLLLILDNCEHLIQACAELTVTLLQACLGLHVLATSREALNVPGEVNWRVPSLAPDEAMLLFADRARAVTPHFSSAGQNAVVMERICERLEGIPLAIELAAARVRTFSVKQIEANLDDAFRLLTGGNRTALPRHQTLHALIDWSFRLLPNPERVLLRRLSVFAGGWALPAATAVAADMNAGPDLPASADDGAHLDPADVPALLDQLVGKSLVGASVSAVADSEGEPRYRMLEVVRQYAHEKLVQAGEYQRMRDRHLAYFCELTDKVNPEWSPLQARSWYGQVQEEIDNVRAALEWALQPGRQAAGVRLVHNLPAFWLARGYLQEGIRWAMAILPDTPTAGDPRTAADTHFTLGALFYAMQDWGQALNHYTAALPLAYQAEDSRLIQDILFGLSWATPNESKAVEYAHELMGIAPEQDRTLLAAELDMNLGHRARLAGDLPTARRLLNSALIAFRALDDTFSVATTLRVLGQVAMALGDDANAQALLEESLGVCHRLRDYFPSTYSETLLEIGTLAQRRGDADAALAMVQECASTHLRLGNPKPVCQCIAVAAGVSRLRGDVPRAAALLSAADALWQSIRQDVYHKADYRFEYERLLPLVRAALPPAEFDAAWAEGQAMSLDQVIADVMAM